MNININMSEVLGKAWKITWKFKVLWIFGILAGCSANNRSSFNNSFNGGSGNDAGGFGDGRNLPEPFRRFLNDPQEAIAPFIREYWAIILVVITLLCVLTLLFYFLGLMGKTGLIKGASQADAGAERLGFGELWGESLRYFWRMFGLSLLVGLPFFIVAVVLVVLLLVGVFGLVNNAAAGAGAMGGLFAILGIFIPAICCLGIVSILVNMIVEQAKNALVIAGVGVLESLRRGWDIFKRNFLTIILISIILGVLNVIVGLIIAIPVLVALAPALGSIVLLAGGSNQTAALAPLAIAGVCFVVYLPVLLVLRGIAQTYIQSALTLTYLRLTTPAPESPVTPASLPPVETSDAQ